MSSGWPSACRHRGQFAGIERVDRLRAPAGEEVALPHRQGELRFLSAGNSDTGPLAKVGSTVGRKNPENPSILGDAAGTLIAPTEV